jgi:hypothetical protein
MTSCRGNMREASYRARRLTYTVPVELVVTAVFQALGELLLGGRSRRRADQRGFRRYGAQARCGNGPWFPGRVLVGPGVLQFQSSRRGAHDAGLDAVALEECAYAGERRRAGTERWRFMPGTRILRLQAGGTRIELAVLARPLAEAIRPQLPADPLAARTGRDRGLR